MFELFLASESRLERKFWGSGGTDVIVGGVVFVETQDTQEFGRGAY